MRRSISIFLILQPMLGVLSWWHIAHVTVHAEDSTPSTTPQCQDLLTNYASCLVDTFDLQSDATACDTCRLEYADIINNSTDVLFCNDIEAIQCSAVKECPCNECSTVLEAYLNCEVINNYNNNECSSGIDCRTSIVNCDNSFDEYRNCIYRLPITTGSSNATSADGKACDECRLDVANQFLDGGTCDTAKTNFCTGVNETCATVCGDCVDELDFFYTCDVLDKSNGNCELDCNTTSTPPTSNDILCSDELSDFAICITQDLPIETDSTACDNCRLNVETSIIEPSISTIANSCTSIQQVSCDQAIPACADVCGTCTTSLSNYWICYSATKSFVDCSSTSCNSTSPVPDAVPQPVPVPVPTLSTMSPTITPTTDQPLVPPIAAPIVTTIMPSIPAPRQSLGSNPMVATTRPVQNPTTSINTSAAVTGSNQLKRAMLLPVVVTYLIIS